MLISAKHPTTVCVSLPWLSYATQNNGDDSYNNNNNNNNNNNLAKIKIITEKQEKYRELAN
jgi:hypothetical protein